MLETPILLWGQHQCLSNTCFRNFLGLPLRSTSLRGQKNSEKNMEKLRAYIMATLPYELYGPGQVSQLIELQSTFLSENWVMFFS